MAISRWRKVGLVRFEDLHALGDVWFSGSVFTDEMNFFFCCTVTCHSSYMGGGGGGGGRGNLVGNNHKKVFLWGAGMDYLDIGHYGFLVSD